MEKALNDKLFLSEETRKQYYNLNNRTYQKVDKLTTHVVENGIVIPFSSKITPPAGGVLNNNIIDSFSLSTFDDPIFHEYTIRTGNFEGELKSTVYIDEVVIYLGDVDSFFGHFLTNSLTRLWLLLNPEYKDYKVCVIGEDRNSEFIEAFYLFGIKKEQLLFVDTLTKFKKVIIPEPSFRYWDYWHVEYKKTLDQIRKNTKKRYHYKKIYLSRSKYFGASGTFGEIPIEKTFKNNGFKIIHPECYSFSDKIDIFANCEVVAGLSGSGMHNVLLCNDNITCYILNRSPCIIPVQLLIDQMKATNSFYIDSYIDILPTLDYSFPYLVGLNKNLESFFYSENIRFTKSVFYKYFSDDLYNFIYFWNQQVIKSNFQYHIVKKYSPTISAIDIAQKAKETLSNYEYKKSINLITTLKQLNPINFLRKLIPSSIKHFIKRIFLRKKTDS